MKNMFSILFTMMLIILFSGCGGNKDEKAELKYGIEKFERKSKICDSTRCAKIVLEYPVIKTAFNNAVKDSLENFIQDALLENYFNERKTNSLEGMSKLFLADYESVQDEPIDYSLSWEINNAISVIHNKNSIVSFQSEFYHFTGGAHGMSGVYFANFNSQTGEKLELSDLLIPGYENELNNTAEKIFRAEKQLSPDANLESEGFWFEGNKFYLNKNFGIKNDGLVFYFNSYEIAPYAMGPTEIKIPYATIKKLVLNDGPLSKMPM